MYNLEDVTIDLDDVTVLVGANGTGKSSLLRSIRWFFEGGDLEIEDISGHDTDRTASVEMTFVELNQADREAFRSYVIDDSLTLWRTYSIADGQKLSGKGRAYLPFERIRAVDSKRDRRTEYRRLREDEPGLNLPAVTSADAADQAMDAWEAHNPDRLQDSTKTANHLFGFVGGGKLAGRFDFVLVPAGSDPSSESQDGRGTLLRQLVDRVVGDSANRKARMMKLEEQVAEELGNILADEAAPGLKALSKAITSDLSELVPSGTVRLQADVPEIRIPDYALALKVTDGGLETELRLQGHGFQRALLITLIRQLATPSDNEDAPGLLLALEEPELYQHPVQARHFAGTLSSLPTAGGGSIQVVYATHSEHFVDPSRYERLRRFQTSPGTDGWPAAQIHSASLERVAQRLDGAIEADQVELRVRITLRRRLAEAVFSNAVLLVEGETDAAVLSGVAERGTGLDASGVSVVPCGGKTNILVPWAILSELGIPTFTVFDGDDQLAERMTQQGKASSDIEQAVNANTVANEPLRAKLNVPETDTLETQIAKNVAVLHDCLETELAAWESFQNTCEAVAEQLGAWRTKSEDVYRFAAAESEFEPPAVFLSIVDKVRSLARPRSSAHTE